jgi:hypothetical protein
MPAKPMLIPLWVKVLYTAFIAVVIPIYLKRYGPTNFLYFCDVAFMTTLIGMWLESSVILSAALVGIFMPQMLWVADFIFELGNFLHLFGADRKIHLTGMTEYMFRPPWFLRFLSFYHFWLPFFLLYLVWCVGYDKRGFLAWVGIAWVVLTVCYAFMPEPSPNKHPVSGELLRDPDMPANINYVYGLTGEEHKQGSMDEDSYFGLYLVTLVVGIYLPTHLLFWWLLPGVRGAAPVEVAAAPPPAPADKDERIKPAAPR